MKKLLYLKGYPEQIAPTLEAFAKFQNEFNRKLIDAYLYPKLLELRKDRRGARKREPTKEILIHNQAILSCYALGLLSKEGRPKQTRLTSEGWILHKTLTEQGKKAYLKKLGKILIDFDKKNNKIIETIEGTMDSPGDLVSIVSLIIALHKIGIEASEKITNPSPEDERELKRYGIDYSKGSRLSDLLKYYQFSYIIVRKGDKIYLNVPRVRDIEKEEILTPASQISKLQFFKALLTVYKANTRSMGSYVPIWPHVRDSVCKELRISDKDFVGILASLPPIIEGNQIHLAHPGKGRPEVQLTRIGKSIYYYIAIFEKGG